MSHFAAGVSPALYMTKSSLPTAPYLGDILTTEPVQYP